MIAKRRRWGTTSRKSSTRLPARSDCWFDSPVTLPFGRARLATRPPPTGSVAIGKTMGMTAVACFTVGTASPFVTMTSTLSRTNSAAISAMRPARPSDQRYSLAMVRPSIQPSARSRSHKSCRPWTPSRSVHAQEPDSRQLPRLLRARRERPCHRAAEQRDEGAPLHSITSSARRRKDSGIFSPIALAVVRLMISSNLVGCKTGRSAGFWPLRMRPT
jgi:hypothetical protein